MVPATCRWRRCAAAAAAVALSLAAQQPPDSSTRRASGGPSRTILAIADVSTDPYQHDSISHALSTIEGLGAHAGLYDTVIRTDLQLVTKGAIAAATGTLTYYKNLDDFDAVVWFASGELSLTAQQKQDLLSFVRDGKGLVVIHSGLATSHAWPEFAEMIGGRSDGEPEAPKDFQVSVSDAHSAQMPHLPKSMRITDAFAPVILRAGPGINVLASATPRAKEKPIPVIWTTSYGSGRVFVSQIGHTDSVWDRSDIRDIILEAIRWAMHD